MSSKMRFWFFGVLGPVSFDGNNLLYEFILKIVKLLLEIGEFLISSTISFYGHCTHAVLGIEFVKYTEPSIQITTLFHQITRITFVIILSQMSPYAAIIMSSPTNNLTQASNPAEFFCIEIAFNAEKFCIVAVLGDSSFGLIVLDWNDYYSYLRTLR